MSRHVVSGAGSDADAAAAAIAQALDSVLVIVERRKGNPYVDGQPDDRVRRRLMIMIAPSNPPTSSPVSSLSLSLFFVLLVLVLMLVVALETPPAVRRFPPLAHHLIDPSLLQEDSPSASSSSFSFLLLLFFLFL